MTLPFLARLIIFLLLASVGHATVPNHRADSLRQRLGKPLADTARVHVLSLLTQELRTIDATQSLAYCRQGLRLARQLHDGLGETQFLNELAINCFIGDDLPGATRYFQQALVRAEQVPQAGRLLTAALLGLGRVATQQQDYAEAQHYFQQGRQRILQRLYPTGPRDISNVDNCLGGLYFNWLNSGQYSDSVARYALYYNRLVLQHFRREGAGPSLIAIGLNDLGLVHGLLQHLDSAEHYHRVALRLLTRTTNLYDLAQTRSWLGATLVARHRPAEALPLLRRAKTEAHYLHRPGLEANCLLQQAAALAAMGQGLEAYRLTRTGQELLDSLQRVEKTANLTQLRVRFDTERERHRAQTLAQHASQQQQQAQRQQQRVWWLASLLLAVALGLLGTGGLAWRLRRQQQQLARQRTEQDRLYALIGHDLRSPVAAFAGLADMLTSYAGTQDTARLFSLADRVRQAAASLHELLDNLLNWALAQRGEFLPAVRPVVAADLLTEASRLYQAAADTAGVELRVEPSKVWVMADSKMTLVILRNLISNALRATPPGGCLTLSGRPANPGYYHLVVHDTGCGMTATELREVLADGLPTRSRSGLGLRLCRHFAQAQGGQFRLTSHPGQGTIATLQLPLAAAFAPESSPS